MILRWPSKESWHRSRVTFRPYWKSMGMCLGKPTINRWRGPIGRGEKGQGCLYFIHRFKRIFAAGKPQRSQKPRLHIISTNIMDESKENVDFDWQRGWECGSNLPGEKGEGRCLEGGPSLHQNHLELLQKKLKFIPVFLERVVALFKKNKKKIQFAQIWENRKVLLK